MKTKKNDSNFNESNLLPNKSYYTLNETELQRMLEYYRVRFKSIVKERIDWLKGLEGINLSTESFHDREWELHNLTEKITQAQQSLSESSIALNNERKRIIKFNNEIENYKSKYKIFYINKLF